MISTRYVAIACSILLCFSGMYTWAESAPVYDADPMPQAFENDQNQDLPPPPPPDEGAYVPPPSSYPTSSLSPDQRLKQIEQRLNNLQNSESSKRLDSLQTQVQSLREQVEQLTHQLQQTQNQLKTISGDVDKRLSQSTKPSSAANDAASNVEVAHKTRVSKPEESVPANDPNVAEEQQIYQTAYNQIKAKKYNDAVSTLQGMLKKYPSGQFASNAHYWLGELYGLMGKNDQALTEFSTVLKTYPDSTRVADAQLKVGMIYASQSKWVDAKMAFKKVINHYPGTGSARLAAEHLKQIKQAGN